MNNYSLSSEGLVQCQKFRRTMIRL